VTANFIGSPENVGLSFEDSAGNLQYVVNPAPGSFMFQSIPLSGDIFAINIFSPAGGGNTALTRPRLIFDLAL
jgi:hypothetical protein